MLRSSLRVLSLGVATLAFAPMLKAQTTSQPLPPELVTALFSGGNSAGPSSRYFVGVVPPNWPAEVMPAPPIVVSGGMRNGSRLTAVFVDSTTRHPVDSVRKQLETAGWVRPPDEPQQGFNATGGFQSNEPRFWFWCRDSVRATVASTAGIGALTYVRVGLETVRGQPCVPDVSRRLGMNTTTLTLPPLPPPTGLRSTRSGGGSGGGSLSATTQLADSTISASLILAHYSALLAKAGWSAYPPTNTSSFALQPLEARDKDGAAWYGALIVVASAKARNVTITMNRPEAP